MARVGTIGKQLYTSTTSSCSTPISAARKARSIASSIAGDRPKSLRSRMSTESSAPAPPQTNTMSPSGTPRSRASAKLVTTMHAAWSTKGMAFIDNGYGSHTMRFFGDGVPMSAAVRTRPFHEYGFFWATTENSAYRSLHSASRDSGSSPASNLKRLSNKG
ncbi:hypothetical protein QNA19_06255 [Rhodococcus fascians]|uniref:hypothetical protein n=1 Tax=Rhodococcoides fascians TaxID=1828 RepID=UPI0024B953D9|nr:hypothetical protein [Rhodococcus fascians]MDJ0425522.1 hypothetical protein [Rhodococcus fascians]